MTEIYRVATTMIGSDSTSPSGLFALARFEKAVLKMAAVDAATKEKMARSQISAEVSKKAAKGERRKMDPHAENHEEKLMSGLVNAQDMRTTFKDIHAPQETIDSIKMLTTLSLVRPEAFSYGVLASDRIPGCLLYGPPGTGKTLLAKAVAKESGANMIEISGASINNMYVGESEKNVRALFRLAKKKEPMVIFIDEADAMLGARGSGGQANGSRRETLNQFLREWDGMDKMKAFIMVATNRPFDLDEAVLRRLPRKLLVDLPLETDRAAILRIHLKDEVIDETVSIEDLAKQTPLYSGSDLKNVCVAAAMAAVKEEVEASERHTGPEPYKWAAKRVLNRRHFDKARKEIGASVSEDMATLAAIRKFDERYGDGKSRKKKGGMGFGVAPDAPDSDHVRIRNER
jgi:SpoVK/Ycf46/Vps4 family AAA+-type ATPase